MSWQQVLLVVTGVRAGPGRIASGWLAGLHPGDLGRVAYQNSLKFAIWILSQVAGSSWSVVTRRYQPDA
jgi:hypothetical protein